MRVLFIIFVCCGLTYKSWGAAADVKAPDPSPFRQQLEGYKTYVGRMADAYKASVAEMIVPSRNLTTFGEVLGYVSPLPHVPKKSEFFAATFREDIGLWRTIQYVTKTTDPTLSPLEEAASILTHLNMDHAKIAGDVDELFTNTTLAGPMQLPPNLFTALFTLQVIQEQASILYHLIQGLLELMPPSYAADFTRNAPKFSMKFKSPKGEPSVMLREGNINITLSSGYQVCLPAAPHPHFYYAQMHMPSSEGTTAIERYCGLCVVMPSGVSFSLRNQNPKEVREALDKVKTLLPEEGAPVALKTLYPTWEEDWAKLQADTKPKDAKAEEGRALDGASILSDGKSVALDVTQKTMLAKLLGGVDIKSHSWDQVVALIQSLGGIPVLRPEIGVFAFPVGRQMIPIKIHYPAFTRGQLTMFSARSLLRGLNDVGWSGEVLSHLLSDAMPKPLLEAAAV